MKTIPQSLIDAYRVRSLGVYISLTDYEEMSARLRDDLLILAEVDARMAEESGRHG